MRRVLLTLLGGAFFACLGASHVAMGAGGDIAWTDNNGATTVADQGGKVFAAGVNFTAEGAKLYVRSHEADGGDFLWGYTSSGFSWIAPSQITVKGRTVVVVGVVDQDTGLDGDWFITGLDARTGEMLWPMVILSDVGFEAPNSVAIAGKYAVVTGTEFEPDFTMAFFVTRSFNLRTGELVWTHVDPRQGLSYGDKVVAFDDDSDSDSDELAIAYGMIANPDNGSDKLIRAYDPASGYVAWDATIDTGLEEEGIDAFTVHDGVAYFAFSSTDEWDATTWQARALDAWTGAPLWMEEYGPGFVDGLAVKGDWLAVAVDCGIQRIDARTGDLLGTSWSDNPWSCLLTPVISQGRIVASGIDGFTFQLDVSAFKVNDGQWKWTTVVPGAFHPWFIGFNVGDSIAAGHGKVFAAGIDNATALDLR